MFSFQINPKPEDIDAMGHVNNVVYLSYAQRVAEEHWKQKGTAEQHQKILWVVLRHEIDYKKPAFLKDKIIGTTWVEPPDGPKTIRYVDLKRAKDGVVLAKVKTLWCAIDAESGRPYRLNEEDIKIFQ